MSDHSKRPSALDAPVRHTWTALQASLALRSSQRAPASCPHTSHSISTPLRVHAWLRQLRLTGYDPALSLWILTSITQGVSIGYVGPTNVKQLCTNLKSAIDHPTFISAAIAKEIGTGRQIGPYSDPPFPSYRISPLGTVSKRIPPGTTPTLTKSLRKIHHLSWPHGSSVNTHISRRAISLSCFDAFADLVRHHGVGCQMSKVDVDSAYRNIPVRPADWHLLGFTWDHVYYWDTVLPFGLASSSLLFETFARAARHIINTYVTRSKTDNYSDDYFQVTRSLSDAKRSLEQTLAILADLGLPVAPHKIEGPSTRLTVLGLEIDSIRMEVRLDSKRLTDMNARIAHWQQIVCYTRKDLESLIGILMFACKAIRPGRIFLHRMLTLLRTIPTHDQVHTLPRDSDMRNDINWWAHHMSTWNGISLMYEPQWTTTRTLCLTTDACLTGYGACYGNEWFAGSWTAEDLRLAYRHTRISMPYLELTALVYAAATWSHHWSRKQITFLCDCDPVVQALTNHASRLPETAQLERTLLHLATKYNFNYRVQHLPGVDNRMADALSRADIQAFRAYHPSANPSPTIRVPLPTPHW
jgi:hypothetical protein